MYMYNNLLFYRISTCADNNKAVLHVAVQSLLNAKYGNEYHVRIENIFSVSCG